MSRAIIENVSDQFNKHIAGGGGMGQDMNEVCKKNTQIYYTAPMGGNFSFDSGKVLRKRSSEHVKNVLTKCIEVTALTSNATPVAVK